MVTKNWSPQLYTPLNENVGPIPDGHGGWYSGTTHPNLSCSPVYVPVYGKPGRFKILADANCTINVKYQGTGQEMTSNNKTVYEHENYHVQHSENNFAKTISLYNSYDKTEVCGKKCAEAITQYLSCHCDMQKAHNEYQGKKYDCEEYSDGVQKKRVCGEEKTFNEKYIEKHKQCQLDKDTMDNACKQ